MFVAYTLVRFLSLARHGLSSAKVVQTRADYLLQRYVFYFNSAMKRRWIFSITILVKSYVAHLGAD